MKRSAIRIGFLLLAAFGSVRGVELKDIKREVEKNSRAIKSARADVEITLALPMSTLSDRFHFQFEYPGKIRVASIKSPGKYRVSGPDTNYVSPAASKDASATLMGALRPDSKGLMFDYLSGIGEDKSARINKCAEDICLTIENELPSDLKKADTSATASGKASISFVYSPKKKVITEVKTLAGPYLSTTVIEYATEAGIKVPKNLTMQNGPTTLRMEFRNWKLNGKVDQNAFK